MSTLLPRRCRRLLLFAFLAVSSLPAEEIPLPAVPDEFGALPPFVFPEALSRVNFEFPVDRILSSEELQKRWDAALNDPETDSGTWETLAMQHFVHERFDRVIVSGERASLVEDPSESLARIVALSFEARQEWARAVQAWERLHQRNPTVPEAGLRAAICLLHLSRPDEALRVVRSLAVSFSDNNTVLHLQGALYWLNGQPRMAWRSLARAGASHNTLLFLAWISAQEEEYEEAIGWLRRALHNQTPQQQAETLAMPYFQGVRDDPAYAFLLADLNLSAEGVEAHTPVAPSSGAARVTVQQVPAARPLLPESLRVSIRLQDYETDAENEERSQSPEEASSRLRLRLEIPPETNEAAIIWHDID